MSIRPEGTRNSTVLTCGRYVSKKDKVLLNTVCLTTFQGAAKTVIL